MNRFFLISFALTLTILGNPAAGSEKNKLSRELERLLGVHFKKHIMLPDSNLIIDFSSFTSIEDDMGQWDKIMIHPGKTAPRKGLQVIQIGFYLNGKFQKELGLQVRARTFQNVVIMREYVKRRERLHETDLTSVRLETTRMADGFFTDFADLSGMRAKKSLTVDETLTKNKVEPIPMVLRGGRIEIHFTKGGLKVVMPGILRQDGGKGDIVLVKCLETSRTYRARIISPKVVNVEL